MACTTYTQDQYDALVAAIAQGVKKVEYSDKKVEYRSLEDMKSLKNDMEACLGIGAAADPKQGKRRVALFSKGV